MCWNLSDRGPVARGWIGFESGRLRSLKRASLLSIPATWIQIFWLPLDFLFPFLFLF
jgi:hypothetical protein